MLPQVGKYGERGCYAPLCAVWFRFVRLPKYQMDSRQRTLGVLVITNATVFIILAMTANQHQDIEWSRCNFYLPGT